MTKRLTEQQREDLIGRRVRYDKSGNRNGWEGVITKFYSEHFIIDYDNDVRQQYQLSALSHPSLNWPDSWYDCGYITILEEDAVSSNANLKVQPFLVCDDKGKVVESFSHAENAVTWASERVSDSRDSVKLYIYRQISTVKTKPHKVIVETK